MKTVTRKFRHSLQEAKEKDEAEQGGDSQKMAAQAGPPTDHCFLSYEEPLFQGYGNTSLNNRI